MAVGGILPPYPVLALVGAQIASPRCPILRPGIFSLSHSLVMVHFLLLGSPINGGRRKFLFPCRPDCLNSTGQLIHRSDVGNRTVQSDRVVVLDELGNQPSSVGWSSVNLILAPQPGVV